MNGKLFQSYLYKIAYFYTLNNGFLDNADMQKTHIKLNTILMYYQKKTTRKKLSKKRKKSKAEPYGYQPNNPLTKYYAKFIESKTKI
jgi:hypothetical protein|tara:strand:- start:2252 stop:2512 length:261 start_codon:yes stop_codon:yes gene_type:complete